MWRYVTLFFVATAVMAACDSGVPGEESGPITTADTTSATDGGKGDDPNPHDTTALPDSSEEGTDTAPDIMVPPPDQLCPTLVALGQVTWYRQDKQNGETLTLSVSAQLNGKCLTTGNRPETAHPSSIHFEERNELPLSADIPDSTVPGGKVTYTLFLEDELLKIKVEYPENGWTLCYEQH